MASERRLSVRLLVFGASLGMPAGAQALRDKLLATDGFMIASPEYNASMPGILKNTIDWVSRFRPQPFNGKQAFLMAASPSMTGGKVGLWALRQPLGVEFLGERTDDQTTRVEMGETAAAV